MKQNDIDHEKFVHSVILTDSQTFENEVSDLKLVIQDKSKRIQSILNRNSIKENLFESHATDIDYKKILRVKKTILEGMKKEKNLNGQYTGYTKVELEFLILKQKAIMNDIQLCQSKLRKPLKYGDSAQL